MADEFSLKRKNRGVSRNNRRGRADLTGGVLGIDRCSTRRIAALAINIALMQRALAGFARSALFVGGDRHRSGD